MTNNDVYIFGIGLHPKSYTVIKEENLKYSISKVVLGDSHFVFLFGIIF